MSEQVKHHNESRMDRNHDGVEAEYVKESNGDRGLSINVHIPVKYFYGAGALIGGLVIGHKLGYIGSKASKVVDVAEAAKDAAVEEAATRG